MDDTAEDDLAGDLRDRLQERDQTVAVAETVTGGRVGAALTATPGASAVLDRVLVPYDYDSLRDLLAVDREALDEYGAVSAEVTAQLARVIRDTADVTWGVANTGIAGPEGGTDDKPVGTAFVAVAYAAPWGSGDSETIVERYRFDGDRATVQSRLRRQTLEDVLNRVREQ